MLRTSKGKLVALLVALLSFCAVKPVVAQAPYQGPGLAAYHPVVSDSVDRAIVLTLSKADQEEVAMAKAALPSLQDPEVKRFAQLMIDDHGSSLTSLTAIATRLKYPLSPDAMMPMTGMAPSDSQFVNAQVAGHEALLTQLPVSDHTIRDRGLRMHVTETRRVVQSHLEKAKRLQARMAGKTT